MASQVTIGRNPQSTIVVDSQYTTVSNNHVTITRDGNLIFLRDHSTNGTYVNGQKIHDNTIAISPNDTITLGHQYPLNMSEVCRYLGGGKATQRMPNHAATAPITADVPSRHMSPEANIRQEPKCLKKWNWGAFVLGWIWGVCNGVYWPLVTLVPYIGQLAALVICFVLGANGSEYAWKEFNGSAEEFDRKQHNWAVGAGIFAIVIVVLTILFFAVILSEL